MTKTKMTSAQGVEVVLFSGDRLLFDRFELPRALVHRYMLIFYGLVIVGLSQLQLYELLKPLSPTERLMVVALSELAAVVAIIFALVILEVMQKPGKRLVLHSTLFSFVAAGLSTLSSEVLVESPPKDTVPGVLHFLIIWGSIHVIMEIATHFVILKIMPRVLLDMRGDRADGFGLYVPPSERIDIKGQEFFPQDIQRISAEGNFIRVVTLEGAHFLPGPYGPVIDTLPPKLGLQLSRSDWVGAVAIAGLRKEGRDLLVVLVDGATVRVAQSRKKVVTEWMQTRRQGRTEEVPEAGLAAMSTQSGK
jgi:hypothetical protein